MTKKQVKLIAPNKNGILCYQGSCKIIIDIRFSNTLKIEPKNKDFHDISVMFEWNWKFIQKKNLLFVFAENNFQDFVLIFANEEICKKVHNTIYKNKEEDNITKEEFQQRLLKPIFQRISRRICSKRFKGIIFDWIDKHEEKMELLKLLKEQKNNQILENVITNVKLENVRKRRFSEIQNVENNDLMNDDLNNVKNKEVQPKRNEIDSSNDKIIVESCFKIVNVKQQNRCFRKLVIFTSSEKTKCYEYQFSSKKQIFYHKCNAKANEFEAILFQDKDGNDCIKVENKSHACTPLQYDCQNYSDLKIINKPDYEIMENCSTLSKRILIIFDSSDRNQCYEYHWSLRYKRFQCWGCRRKNRLLVAEICHENAENEYIRLLNDRHICEMRKYNPEKFNQINKFVLLPNYEIQTKIKNGCERKYLIIIFEKNGKKMCFSYYHNFDKTFYCSRCSQRGKKVSAKICQNSDGEEYVILSNGEHLCSPNIYTPQQKEIILHPPNIKYIEASEKHTSKVIVFDSNDNQLCYVFTKHAEEGSKKYYCLGCKRLTTSEKLVMTSTGKCEKKEAVFLMLCKNENDTNCSEYYVKLMDGQKHICEPQKYEPEKYEIITLKPNDDYFLLQKKEKSKDSISLVIYDHLNKNFGYKYYYHKASRLFNCWLCEKKGAATSAKLHQDSNGNEYIIPNQIKHVCNSIKVSSIKAPGTLILEKSGLSFGKSTIEVDGSQIVRKPNFQLQRNRFGVPEKKLIVFKSDDKTLCYEYHHENGNFRCNKCRINARLYSENDEKYIILSRSEHKCEPLKFEAVNKFVEASDFMIFNQEDDSKLTKLIIFTSSTKELCYEYTFIPYSNTFRCCGCYASRKNASAKVVSNDNGEEYIQLLKNEHICTPKKFVLEEFQPKIVPDSGFLLCTNTNGTQNSKLILFDSRRNGFGYVYCMQYNNSFVCYPCKREKKRVTAKLCEKETGEKYLELSVEKHACKSKKYNPQKLNEKKNVLSNFVVQYNTTGIIDSRITIFDENDKNLGYQYSLKKSKNAFACCECFKKDKFISVRLKVDEEGKQFVEYGQKEHYCTIQNLKEKNLIFDDFKFEENENILIANESNRKRYKFKYDEGMDAFCCIKCKGEKKKIITATVCNRNDGKEFLLLNDTHSCTALLK